MWLTLVFDMNIVVIMLLIIMLSSLYGVTSKTCGDCLLARCVAQSWSHFQLTFCKSTSTGSYQLCFTHSLQLFTYMGSC